MAYKYDVIFEFCSEEYFDQAYALIETMYNEEIGLPGPPKEMLRQSCNNANIIIGRIDSLVVSVYHFKIEGNLLKNVICVVHPDYLGDQITIRMGGFIRPSMLISGVTQAEVIVKPAESVCEALGYSTVEQRVINGTTFNVKWKVYQ